MGTYKAEVFIASRFDEFTALRARLTHEIAQTKYLAPVDLSDGYARHQPPLAECLSRVRAAEFMLLLLGDSYGPNAPGHAASFTHLEYAEAIREGSKTCVLVYRVKGPARPNERAIPDSWLRELEERHTCRDLSAEDPAAQANEIIKHLSAALYDLRFGEVSEQDDALPDDLAEDAFDDSEVEALDAVEAGARGESPGIDDDPDEAALAAHRGPAATAALEQRREAVRGTQLGEYGIAIQHLRKALELRPLDGLSNFLLARLYVATGRLDRLGEAVNLAERAARVASDEQRPYRASNAYLLAARARTELGHPSDAHGYVDLALELKPDFAKAHLERARIFCRADQLSEAVDSVRAAFQFHNASLYQALRDPHLRRIRAELRSLLRKETSRWQADVQRLLEVERQLRGLITSELPPLGEPASTADGLQKLRRLGQESVARQRELVSLILSAAERSYRDSQTEIRASSAYELASRIRQGEQKLALAATEEQNATLAVAEARKLPRLIDWTVLPPLLLAAVLAYFVPWISAEITLGVGGILVSLRNAWHSKQRFDRANGLLGSANTRLEGATRHLGELEQLLAAQRSELEALRERGEHTKSAAKQALDVFEGRSLSMPGRYQPYSNLRRAHPGSLVRISPKAVEQFERAYRRRIEHDESALWVEPSRNSDGFALYRVADASALAIRLSRGRAYEPSRDSVPLTGLAWEQASLSLSP